MPVELGDRQLVSVALDHVEIEALVTGLVLTNAALANRACRGEHVTEAVNRSRTLIAKLEHAQRILAGP